MGWHRMATLMACVAMAGGAAATAQDAPAPDAEPKVDETVESPAPPAGALTVGGEVKYKKTGAIDVRLCTEEEFPGVGDCSWGVRLEPGSSPGTVSFELRDVPPGVYGLRAYQDENGNGVLDIGMFGPKEPWALHRPARPKFRAPRFKDVAFELKESLEDLVLDVR